MVQSTLHTLLLASLTAIAAARKCQNLTVPISISARNTNFSLQAPSTNVDVTDFVLNFSQPGVNFTKQALGPNGAPNSTDGEFATITGTYTIGATYCEPDSGPGSALQILTHGVAFDRSYWDFAAQDYNYSYVNAALARNYSTFAYDRLGLGASSRGEPVNEIQTGLEVAALHALTTQLRQTAVPGIEASYDKVLHVGHSYGSVQTWALTAMYEGISDGIVLTGFSEAGDFVPYFMLGGNYVLAHDASPALASYPPGYLASADMTAVQIGFFAPGNFDPAILAATYRAGQPVTIGELMTLGGVTTGNNTFGGPVLIVTGERDIPFCGGNCDVSNPPIPAQANQSFTNTSYFDAIIVPGAGHGLNLVNTYFSL
ncbi:Alpha/beta hydrolase family-domain-containing protein [Hypoxylon sp. NC0597]|nr:Alpha/beta hydrolase family-domain-containing protein [Hypoxylon sp. NC0597]